MEPTRRQVVRMLGALGLNSAATTELMAQAPTPGVDALKCALAIQGRDLSQEQLDVIRRALQRNLEQFQAVRDLEIDDRIAPLVIFSPPRS